MNEMIITPTHRPRSARVQLGRLVAMHPAWLLRPDHLAMLQRIARRLVRPGRNDRV